MYDARLQSLEIGQTVVVYDKFYGLISGEVIRFTLKRVVVRVYVSELTGTHTYIYAPHNILIIKKL